MNSSYYTGQVLNHFAKALGLYGSKPNQYSSREMIVNFEGYKYAEQKMYDFLDQYGEQLKGMEDWQIVEALKQVFRNAFNYFNKTFDVDEWRRNQNRFNLI